MTDLEIEQNVIMAGGRWDGDHWKFEDADLHQFVRALLAAERERCARLCETINRAKGTAMYPFWNDCASAIRRA